MPLLPQARTPVVFSSPSLWLVLPLQECPVPLPPSPVLASASSSSALNDLSGSSPSTPQRASSAAFAGFVAAPAPEPADWVGIEETLRVVAHNNARVVSFATRGRSDDVLPSARIPTASLGVVEVPVYTADPAVLRESSITLAPEGALARGGGGGSLWSPRRHGPPPPPPPGIYEVERIEQECRYNAVMDLCTIALSSNGATGAAGALDVGGVSVAGLASAIDAARMLAATTPRALHVRARGGGVLRGDHHTHVPPHLLQLTDLCRLMWQSRTAVLEDDWATVEGLLGACGGVLGLTAPLPPGCVVPPSVLAEMALYRAESNNRKAVAALSRGIIAGAPEGEVGRLSLASVDVRPVRWTMAGERCPR